jgi:hypothetical protein
VIGNPGKSRGSVQLTHDGKQIELRYGDNSAVIAGLSATAIGRWPFAGKGAAYQRYSYGGLALCAAQRECAKDIKCIDMPIHYEVQ